MKFEKILEILKENKSSKKMLMAFMQNEFPNKDVKEDVNKLYKQWAIDWSVEVMIK